MTGTTTVGNYTPHMSVTGPSTYWDTETPVEKLTVYSRWARWKDSLALAMRPMLDRW